MHRLKIYKTCLLALNTFNGINQFLTEWIMIMDVPSMSWKEFDINPSQGTQVYFKGTKHYIFSSLISYDTFKYLVDVKFDSYKI